MLTENKRPYVYTQFLCFSRGTEQFRHDYSKLVSLKAIASDAPTLLCTATMTCDMFKETCDTLYMKPSEFKNVFRLPDRFDITL